MIENFRQVLLMKVHEKHLQEKDSKLSEKTRLMTQILIKPSKRRTDEDLEYLIPLIQKIQFFKERDIKQENYKLIVESLTYEYHQAGELVFSQGEQGDKFYIIIEGQVSVRVMNKEYERREKEISQLKQKMLKSRKSYNEYLVKSQEYVVNGQEVPGDLTDKIAHANNDIKQKAQIIEDIEEELQNIKEHQELMKLQSGQSFGELALITNKPRQANIMCLNDCHFAVMNKQDYERVLQKMEMKVQVLKQEFLHGISFLRRWTRKNLQNLGYYLTSKEYPRSAVVFREGDPVEHIAIIKHGEFQITKKIPRSVTTETDIEALLDSIKRRDKIKTIESNSHHNSHHQNQLASQGTQGAQGSSIQAYNSALTQKQAQANPYVVHSLNNKKLKVNEDKTLQSISVTLLGSGQSFGEIDLMFERNYSYSLLCNSVQNQIYLIKADDFIRLLQHVKGTWSELEQHCILKNDQLVELIMNQFMSKWQNKKNMNELMLQRAQSAVKIKKKSKPQINLSTTANSPVKISLKHENIDQGQSTQRQHQTFETQSNINNNNMGIGTTGGGLNIDLSKVNKGISSFSNHFISGSPDIQKSIFVSQRETGRTISPNNKYLADRQDIIIKNGKRSVSRDVRVSQEHVSVPINTLPSKIQKYRSLSKLTQPDSTYQNMHQSNIHQNSSNMNNTNNLSQFQNISINNANNKNNSSNAYDDRALLDQLFQSSLICRTKQRQSYTNSSMDQYDLQLQANLPVFNDTMNNQIEQQQNNIQSFNQQQSKSFSVNNQKLSFQSHQMITNSNRPKILTSQSFYQKKNRLSKIIDIKSISNQKKKISQISSNSALIGAIQNGMPSNRSQDKLNSKSGIRNFGKEYIESIHSMYHKKRYMKVAATIRGTPNLTANAYQDFQNQSKLKEASSARSGDQQGINNENIQQFLQMQNKRQYFSSYYSGFNSNRNNNL
ncbi:cyclic nucleotide-binding domain containing protein [Stylonychia lemnae]|uniref:Cyclic nucleotide-binding domain containing protein n=1 Tax=Stylonychia lemnae TaxID=5949 RepID=A0A078B1V1_STYLE|nr:cyclic nucleotide-binding domain containing protein [Stylonychia lemnae]|eukprot:CDW88479.1 cyclic nucleotide-binding domain containing protein [Stylonychia lemnae]